MACVFSRQFMSTILLFISIYLYSKYNLPTRDKSIRSCRNTNYHSFNMSILVQISIKRRLKSELQSHVSPTGVAPMNERGATALPIQPRPGHRPVWTPGRHETAGWAPAAAGAAVAGRRPRPPQPAATWPGGAAAPAPPSSGLPGQWPDNQLGK